MSYKCRGVESDEIKLLMRYRKDLVLKNGLLYRRTQLKGHDSPILQFVIPKSFRVRTVTSMHDELGHLGMDHTLSLLQNRFFWYQMAEDVHKTIHNCDRCLRFKTKPEKEQLNPIDTTYPLELVHLDYLSIGESGSDRTKSILVITDHFTKYAQAYVTSSQNAHVTTRVLWEQFLIHYGWPTKIIMDQGHSFENKLFKELCDITKVQKLQTSPYHPETNGPCECFNGTLISMLGTLSNEDKSKWTYWVPSLVHTYN